MSIDNIGLLNLEKERTYEPDKLSNMCIDYLKYDLSNPKPEFKKIKQLFENYVSDRFPMLIERYENLKDIIGNELYLKLLNIKSDRINVESKFKNLKGDVMKLEEIVIDNIDWEGKNEGFYPLKVLLQGVKWPDGIDCSKREKYLCDNEFQKVFNCSKEEFDKKDKYKRIELKKKHLLF